MASPLRPRPHASRRGPRRVPRGRLADRTIGLVLPPWTSNRLQRPVAARPRSVAAHQEVADGGKAPLLRFAAPSTHQDGGVYSLRGGPARSLGLLPPRAPAAVAGRFVPSSPFVPPVPEGAAGRPRRFAPPSTPPRSLLRGTFLGFLPFKGVPESRARHRHRCRVPLLTLRPPSPPPAGFGRPMRPSGVCPDRAVRDDAAPARSRGPYSIRP